MVKHLASKRTDKSLSVQAYWDIRESLKARTHTSRPINPHIEDKLHARFRYQRHKNLVRQFNPLAVLLQDRIAPEDSHTQQLLENLTDLPKPINKVRGMCLTLPLMLHNLPLVLKLLTDNLHIEDSWRLLEAVLRDSGAEAMNIFLQDLGKLLRAVDQAFDNALFKKIFAVLAVFFESCFDRISSHLQEVWATLRQTLFTHDNKYIRKFSIESFGYVLSRLTREHRYSLYHQLIHQEQDIHLVAAAMLSELRPLAGYLTHLSAERFGELWDSFSCNIALAQEQTNGKYSACMASLLCHMADSLTVKLNQDSDMMFNLCDMLRIVSEKSLGLLRSSHLVEALSPVLKCLDHAFSSNKHAHGCLEITQYLSKLLKEALAFNPEDLFPQIPRLLAVHLWSSKEQASKDLYFQYLSRASADQRRDFMEALIQQSSKTKSKFKLPPGLATLLVLICKHQLGLFMNALDQSEQASSLVGQMYTLCLVLKHSQFHDKIAIDRLQVDASRLSTRLKQLAAAVLQKDFSRMAELFTLLKLLKHVQLSPEVAACSSRVFSDLNSLFNQHLDELFEQQLPKDNEGWLFDIGHFLRHICAYDSHLVPSLEFALNFKQLAQEFAVTHSLPVSTEDEQRFYWLFNSRDSLMQTRGFEPNLLATRVRTVRYHHLAAVASPCPLVSVLLDIDRQEVNLQTEREVKRLMSTISVGELTPDQATILAHWCVGFAYTGFKLVEQPLVELLASLLDLKQPQTCPVVLAELQYMNMKLSRKFQPALATFLNSCRGALAEFCATEQPLKELLREEYPPTLQDTAESIGFERLTSALRMSVQGRQYLQQELRQLLDTYFAVEFVRGRRSLEQLARTSEDIEDQTAGRLLPPHPLQLSLMMRILPEGYRPPYEVLHFDNSAYLPCFEGLRIKTVPWESIWQKKGDEQTHYTLQGKLTRDEQRLYLHFLWKFVLQGDELKRRQVFEHLRTELADLDVPYLLNLCLSQLCIDLEDITPTVAAQASRKLELLGEKQLTAFLRTLASILQILKMSIQKWTPPLAALIVLITQQTERRSESSSTKLLRRTCGKTLVLLYREFAMFPLQIEQSARTLFELIRQNVDKLQTGSLSGVPVLLRVLLEWSRIPLLKLLFTEGTVLQGISQVYSHPSKKQAVELVSELLSNLYDADEEGTRNIAAELQPVTVPILQNFAVHFKSLAIPSLAALGLLKQMIPYAESIPEDISAHTLATITHLLGKSQTYQLKYHDNIAGLFELVQAIASKQPLAGPRYREVMQLLPLVSSELRLSVVAILASDCQAVSQQVHQLVSCLYATTQKGLDILPDYSRILPSLAQLQAALKHMSPLEREYVLLSVIPMATNDELAVKAAAGAIMDTWLAELVLPDLPQFKVLYRVVLQLLKTNSRQESTFFSCVAIVGKFLQALQRIQFVGLSSRDTLHSQLKLCEGRPEQNFFKLISSLELSFKLRAVNMLKANLEGLLKQKCVTDNGDRHDLPSTLVRVLLPIMEQLISSKSKGNLSSSLSLACTKLEGQLFALLQPSELKQELKRLAMHLDFKETHSKKNVLTMKLLNQILDNVTVGKSVLPALENQIKENGIEVLNYQREGFELEEAEEQEEEQVNQKYIRLDRKMIVAEEDTDTVDPLISFLRKCLLVPLKSMLFFQSRSGSDESKDSTSRLFLTVVLTKLLLRFPLPIFLIEFNKIVTKLSRMLKKKSQDVRDNARKCLSQIVKLTGAPLLHVVIRELSFHLNQNFERHIFVYSVYFIVNELVDQPHILDYCLPLVLPCCYEDIFGQSSNEKELANDNAIPTTIFEVKKRKGFELLALAARLVSPAKVEHLIYSLRAELRKQLTSEERLTRFEALIGNVMSGLSKNSGLTTPDQLVPFLGRLITESSDKLRLFDINESLNETTVRSELKRQRAVTKEEVLTLQAETGRGGSIFRKVNRDIVVKRNTDLLVSCYSNLHLSLVLLAFKRGLLTQQISAIYPQETSLITTFVLSCLEHNSNSVLSKALRIESELLKWSSGSLSQVYRQTVLKKVLKNLDRLASGEKELARECFIIVNMTMRETAVPAEFVGPLLEHIKLHIDEDVKQAYQLLKTLLLKHSRHPGLLAVVDLVKQNMITTYRDDIRKSSRSVYCSYLRECAEQKRKQGQLQFLLKNLDYPEQEGRQTVLDCLEELLAKFSATELEHYAQIIFMTLLAAYSVEQEQQLRAAMQSLQQNLLRSLSKSKMAIIKKQGECWVADPDKSIRLNGLNTFLLWRGDLSLHEQKEVIAVVAQEVAEAALKLEAYFAQVKHQQQQKNRLRNESQWSNIISAIVDQPTTLEKSLCLVASLELAVHLPKLHENSLLVGSICFLCCTPNKQEHIAAVTLLEQLVDLCPDIIAAHFTSHSRLFGDSICALKLAESQKLMVKVLYTALGNKQSEFAYELLVMIRKIIHHSLKLQGKEQNTLDYLIHLLMKVLGDPEASRLLSGKQEKLVMVQAVNKLANHQETMSELTRQSLEKLLEALKQTISAGAYYEISSSLKVARQEKIREKKTSQQQLAITDHELYQQERTKKKVKRTPK